MAEKVSKKANALIHESSPYLLQHAYNPVQWLPFSEEAFEQARSQNKLVLVSVGYSACHWCHVMEKECFEDEAVAEVMNRNFVCIKVDREERSDVDMLYMQAVLLMTGQGGWPLNCFTLADGRPIYGGTYFNRQQWLQVLEALARMKEQEPDKIERYASELTNGIHRAESFITTAEKNELPDRSLLEQCIENWRRNFDNEEGGPDRAPKFPLPSNYLFLLRYAFLADDVHLMKHVELTLEKMAFGGINDQLRGGFARYSTDKLWKVPHFEKMLYDNAQLCSLYIEAFTVTGNQLYAEVAETVLSFVSNEWLSPEGGFYSAYDADSEGVEGKYYVWSREELKDLLGDDFDVFAKYFEINEKGYWEDDNYILMRNPDVTTVLGDLNLRKKELFAIIERCREKLLKAAAQRVKPGLDDKIISAWNSQMCTAFAKAYLVFGKEQYKNTAVKAVDFINSTVCDEQGRLKRTYKNGRAKIFGFLDDYAFLIEALLAVYLITQDEKYLRVAEKRTAEALELFHNPESPFLFYTSTLGEKLVARNTETSDNVIPSSNSQMALNLYYLSDYLQKNEWSAKSSLMLGALSEELVAHGTGYSNWGCLALHHVFPPKEVAVVGKNVDEKLRELYRKRNTNTIFAVSAEASELPLLKDRAVREKTMIYVCENKTCKLPVETVEEALVQLQ